MCGPVVETEDALSGVQACLLGKEGGGLLSSGRRRTREGGGGGGG